MWLLVLSLFLIHCTNLSQPLIQFKYGKCPWDKNQVKDISEFRIGAIWNHQSKITFVEKSGHYLSPLSISDDVPLVNRRLDTLVKHDLGLFLSAGFIFGENGLINYKLGLCYREKEICKPQIPPPKVSEYINYVTGIEMIPGSDLVIATIEVKRNASAITIGDQVAVSQFHVLTWTRGEVTPELSQPLEDKFMNRDFAFAQSINGSNWFYIFWDSGDQGVEWYSKQPLDTLRNFPVVGTMKYDYRPITHWTGCPQDLCFEGTIDAMIKNPGKGNWTVFREFYEFEIVNHKLTSVIKLSNIVNAATSVMFKDGSRWNLIFSGKKLILRPESKFNNEAQVLITHFFEEVNPDNDDVTTINAAFYDSTNHKLHLIVHSMIYIYNTSIPPPGDTEQVAATLINKIQVNHLFPGLIWPVIDAAEMEIKDNEDSDNNGDKEKVVNLFYKDFNIKYKFSNLSKNVGTYLVSEPVWTIGEFWKCPDEHYKNSVSKLFRINNLKQFKDSFGQVRSVPRITFDSVYLAMQELDTLITSSFDPVTKTLVTSSVVLSDESKDKLSPVLIAAIVAGVIGVVVVIIIVIAVCCLSSKQKSADQKAKDALRNGSKEENMNLKKKNLKPVRKIDSFTLMEEEVKKRNAQKVNSIKK